MKTEIQDAVFEEVDEHVEAPQAIVVNVPDGGPEGPEPGVAPPAAALPAGPPPPPPRCDVCGRDHHYNECHCGAPLNEKGQCSRTPAGPPPETSIVVRAAGAVTRSSMGRSALRRS